MDNKMKGVLLGTGGVILWFTPFAYVEFMGMNAYQSGQHIGGIAYILLLALIIYAVLSWFEQHQLAIVFAGVATCICALFAIQAGSSIAWGLIALLILSILSLFLALQGKKTE